MAKRLHLVVFQPEEGKVWGWETADDTELVRLVHTREESRDREEISRSAQDR